MNTPPVRRLRTRPCVASHKPRQGRARPLRISDEFVLMTAGVLVAHERVGLDRAHTGAEM